MEKKQLGCDLCNVNSLSQEELDEHLKGKKHLKLVQKKEALDKKVSCGVYVRGYHYNTPKEEVITYFSKFGRIKLSNFGSNYAILEYENVSSAEEVLSQKRHLFRGRNLFVDKRRMPVTDPNPKPTPEDLDEDFLNDLKIKDTLSDQIVILLGNLRPEYPRTNDHYNEVCRDMYESLVSEFPACEVWRFGSSTTGLEFKNSDVDVYVSRARPPDTPDVDCLKTARYCLQKSGKFRNSFLIPNAKIPILTTIHSKTQIKCDINFRNGLGVCNSRLLKYYLTLDEKLLRVMYVVKYWAKVHCISGKNHLFSNYSLSLMFIFYLQRIFSFPSVRSLQMNPRFHKLEEIWNGGFEPYLLVSNEISAASYSDLLTGFFVFYSDFHYSFDIICPYLGEPIKKTFFSDFETVPDEFLIYKRYRDAVEPLKFDKPICLQDPFEHSRNTTSVIVPSTLDLFVSKCRWSRQIMDTNAEKDVLFLLLQEQVVPVQNKKKSITIKMGNNLKYLRTIENVNDIENRWFEIVLEFLVDVMRNVFKFDLEEIPDGTIKRSKLNDQKDVHDDVFKCVTFSCSAKNNFWDARKACLKIGTPNVAGATGLEREKKITEHLCEINSKIVSDKVLLEVEMYVSFEKNPCSVTVQFFRKDMYKKVFVPFLMCFSSKIVDWFEKYEVGLNSA